MTKIAVALDGNARAVLLDDARDIWNGSAFVTYPTSGAYPANTLISPITTTGLLLVDFEVPSGAESADWLMLIYASSTPAVEDLFVTSVGKPDESAAIDIKERMPIEILVVGAGSTTSSINVTASTGIASEHLLNASIILNEIGGTRAYSRITAVGGSAPNYVLTVNPVLPVIPNIGEKLILGPKYLESGSL